MALGWLTGIALFSGRKIDKDEGKFVGRASQSCVADMSFSSKIGSDAPFYSKNRRLNARNLALFSDLCSLIIFQIRWFGHALRHCLRHPDSVLSKF